ncbi:MAG: M23 family metallopeptidase [Candidatus Doudnabacteria bacterium]|nr:M23 family metallopeptidase [Candidatus Doudnabacteria bacterium]
MRKLFLSIFAVSLLAAGCGFSSGPKTQPITTLNPPTPTPAPELTPGTATSSAGAVLTPTSDSLPSGLSWPISDALSRVTKKPFGLYVSPGHSPVSPEKFTGYHTGTDFETTAAEKNIDVPIFAICSGKLLLKKWASGYGGVAVESCTIDNQPVTIIYGHLRESSISPAIGQAINTGDKIAVLGTGYSQETDGERKHLHLGIHKGSAINILGYVQNASNLSAWNDPLAVLK